jgi:glycerophosphoryl diester phosphodiesterase
MDIIAHRGASYDAPENTLAAVRLAWAQHADAVEVDVHLTRDGQLAVIHDEDLRRVAGDPRQIANTTLAELEPLDVGNWKDAKFAGEKIPALAKVLALVPAGKRVFVEIKGGPEVVTALERCVAASGLAPGQVVTISFDRFAAQAAKLAMPRHAAAWILDSVEAMGGISIGEILDTAQTLGLDALDFEAGWPLDERLMQQIHRRGFQVYVWTVDDVRRARRLRTAGLDGVTTNRPGWLRSQLAS